MMLAKINDDLYIDLSDIYLIDRDEYQANELLVYIKTHPKIPIILKDEESIYTFKKQLDNYMTRIPYEQKHTTAENVQSASQTVLEDVNSATEARFQQNVRQAIKERLNDDSSLCR